MAGAIRYTEEFKRKAVAQIVERGYAVAALSDRQAKRSREEGG